MRDERNYTVVLEPQPKGGFTVHVPALPEVVTEGDTEEEALAMARDAIALVLVHRRAFENGPPGQARGDEQVRNSNPRHSPNGRGSANE